MAGKQKQTLYDVLEIKPSAPQHEIYAAYQRAKATYGQESPALYSMFTKEEARDLMNLIEEAFTVLGNHNSRRRYDHQLLGTPAGESPPRPITGDDLPDFPAPDEQHHSRKSAKPQMATNSNESTVDVPEGFSRTKMGIYKIDDELEAEILHASEFSGPLLRKVRQYKNISLEQLAKITKISKSYLVAVESEDYHAMPAQVFVRGFVVQMARTLGLDENKVANSYMNRLKKATLD